MTTPKKSLRDICRAVGVDHLQVTEVLRRINSEVLGGFDVITQEVGTFRRVVRKATTRTLNGVTYDVPETCKVQLRYKGTNGIPNQEQPVEIQSNWIDDGGLPAIKSFNPESLSGLQELSGYFSRSITTTIDPEALRAVSFSGRVYNWGNVGGVEYGSEQSQNDRANAINTGAHFGDVNKAVQWEFVNGIVRVPFHVFRSAWTTTPSRVGVEGRLHFWFDSP